MENIEKIQSLQNINTILEDKKINHKVKETLDLKEK